MFSGYFSQIHCKLALAIAGCCWDDSIHRLPIKVFAFVPSSALTFMLVPPFRAFALNAFNRNRTSSRAPHSKCLGHRRCFPRVALMLEWGVFLQNPLHWFGGNSGEAGTTWFKDYIVQRGLELFGNCCHGARCNCVFRVVGFVGTTGAVGLEATPCTHQRTLPT